MYKQALDLFGVKNVLDVTNPNDLKQVFTSGTKIEGKFSHPQDKVQLLSRLLQEAKQRRQGTKDLVSTFWDKYDSRGIGSHYDSADKQIRVVPGQEHPAVIAHQVGHSAQKIRPRLADLWRGTAIIRPAIFSVLPNYIKLIRQKFDKDYDPAKFDTADIATGIGLGATNAAAAWKFGTDTIKNELNASGRGLRYLRNASINSRVFSDRTLKESKQILRGALKTYKKARILDTIFSAIGPIVGSGIDALIRRAKGKKQLPVQK